MSHTHCAVFNHILYSSGYARPPNRILCTKPASHNASMPVVEFCKCLLLWHHNTLLEKKHVLIDVFELSSKTLGNLVSVWPFIMTMLHHC